MAYGCPTAQVFQRYLRIQIQMIFRWNRGQPYYGTALGCAAKIIPSLSVPFMQFLVVFELEMIMGFWSLC